MRMFIAFPVNDVYLWNYINLSLALSLADDDDLMPFMKIKNEWYLPFVLYLSFSLSLCIFRMSENFHSTPFVVPLRFFILKLHGNVISCNPKNMQLFPKKETNFMNEFSIRREAEWKKRRRKNEIIIYNLWFPCQSIWFRMKNVCCNFFLKNSI